MDLIQSDINPHVTLVRVDAYELQCDYRKLPYSTYLGTINWKTGRIEVWSPAASKPRGYRSAAKHALEMMLEKGR